MKQLTTLVLLLGIVGASTGCVVHDRHPRTVVVKEKRGNGCGPAYHWDGRGCVHNGKAKGHDK